MNVMTRTYQLKRRSEQQDQTRQKIIEAAIVLHQSKGLAATSMSDIAKQAKVGKVTVYRHFPDEMALMSACSGLYFQRHPFPDPEQWTSTANPIERLRRALLETYNFHEATEDMISKVLAEARDHPVMMSYHAHWESVANVIAAAWPVRGSRQVQLKAAIALTLSFDTWHTLVREQKLSKSQAIELMERLTCDCPLRSR